MEEQRVPVTGRVTNSLMTAWCSAHEYGRVVGLFKKLRGDAMLELDVVAVNHALNALGKRGESQKAEKLFR